MKEKINFSIVPDDDGVSWSNEPIPETDSTPHVNIGTQFQCNIPPFTSAPNRANPEPTYEDLLWDPGINNCTDSEGNLYTNYYQFIRKNINHQIFDILISLDRYFSLE